MGLPLDFDLKKKYHCDEKKISILKILLYMVVMYPTSW